MPVYTKTKSGIPADVDAAWMIKGGATGKNNGFAVHLSNVFLRKPENGAVGWVAFSPDAAANGFTGEGKTADDAVSALMAIVLDDMEASNMGADAPKGKDVPAEKPKKGKGKAKKAEPAPAPVESADTAESAKGEEVSAPAPNPAEKPKKGKKSVPADKAEPAPVKSAEKPKKAKKGKGDKVESPEPVKASGPAQEKEEKAARVLADKEKAVEAERARLKSLKEQRDTAKKRASDPEAVRYVAGKIRNAWRRSSAQLITAQQRLIAEGDALHKIRAELANVRDAGREIDHPRLADYVRDISALIERHEVLLKGGRPQMSAVEAKTVRKRVARIGFALGLRDA